MNIQNEKVLIKAFFAAQFSNCRLNYYCGNVNSNANFGIYIQYLQQPWTLLYAHLKIQIMVFLSW